VSDWWREFDRRRNIGCVVILIVLGGLFLPIPVILLFHIPDRFWAAVMAVSLIMAMAALIVGWIKNR
jgi:flagellar biosynthesis component FlhA